MPIYLGNVKQNELYYGGVKIKEAYYGSIKVYGSAPSQTIRFDYTGAVQTWTVPAGVSKLIVDCVGASGNTEYCGKGGRVQCVLTVSVNQVLNIYIGGNNGWNGGSGPDQSRYRSGGASDIRIGGTTLNDRKIVAGGGGCGWRPGGINIVGGAGGGLTGGDGNYYGGKGGTQTSGGRGDTVWGYSENGSFGAGAYGGGGGWYGGGSAGDYGLQGGGGGGSSYTDPNLCTNVVHTQGYSEATGNGWIIITTG